MRSIVLFLAAFVLGACTDEALLCSEDPACEASGCGPAGCSGRGRLGGGEGGDGAGGAGGVGGGGGAGGAVGEEPPVCRQMCERVYLQCGSVLYDSEGGLLTFDQCLDSCALGAPSQAQAACMAQAICGDFARCLQQVPAEICDAVCAYVYDGCGGSLIVDGRLVDAADCAQVCPTGLTLGQATCILGSSCADWPLCAPAL